MTEVSNTALLVLLILVLVFVVILVFIFVLCLPWCCPFFFIGCTRRRRLRVAINEFLEEQLDENKEAIHQINDLENQVDNQDPQNNADAASNVALNSFPMNSTHSTRLQPPFQISQLQLLVQSRKCIRLILLQQQLLVRSKSICH